MHGLVISDGAYDRLTASQVNDHSFTSIHPNTEDMFLILHPDAQTIPDPNSFDHARHWDTSDHQDPASPRIWK